MKRKQPFTYKEFEKIYSKVPRLCVDMIIKTNKGILLTQRSTGYGWENQWHFPGGTVLYREKLESTLKRVAKEETGLNIKVVKLIDYMEFFSEVKERGFGYSVSFAFLVKPTDKIINFDKYNGRVKFFKKLPENMIKEQKVVLTKFLKSPKQ